MGTLTIPALNSQRWSPMPNRSSLIAPNERPACQTAADVSFIWDTVHQTVLKFVNPLACQQTIATEASSENLLAAMQRLVTMINTLRSSLPPSLDESSERLQDKARTLDLIPYVSEEAYDVMDTLREEKSHKETASSQHTPTQQQAGESNQLNSRLTHSSPHPLIAIDTLIPSVLWSIARSSYSAMHLIEGGRVTCWQPDQGWAVGMLRLVVMLEAETPAVRWCFDLATGYPAESLLEPLAIVQSDELALPIRCALAEASLSTSPCQVHHQLQAVLQRLQIEVPGLSAFLHGVAVDLLQPGTNWQAGKLRLRLGFAFSAQTPDDADSESIRTHPELIEAELMDEMAGSTQSSSSQSAAPLTQPIAGLLAKTHVVVNPTVRSLKPSTLVRVTEADTLEHYTQQLARQQLEQSLFQLQSQQASDDESAQLALVVQTAIARCDHDPGAAGIGLLHPMLLMDELVPKLLWSITSSTYEIMQLVGGLPTQVLQPHANWQQGTLRLLAALHLKTVDVDDTLDLSTGRSINADAARLGLGTIIQTNAILGSQPIPLETLTTHLQHQLYNAVPEYRLLLDGVSIAWLEDVEQDWQTGTMKLSVSLAFIPDVL